MKDNSDELKELKASVKKLTILVNQLTLENKKFKSKIINLDNSLRNLTSHVNNLKMNK